jgi:hypothetical protein
MAAAISARLMNCNGVRGGDSLPSAVLGVENVNEGTEGRGLSGVRGRLSEAARVPALIHGNSARGGDEPVLSTLNDSAK